MKPEDIPKELFFVYGNEMQKRIKLLNYLREVSYTYTDAGNRRLSPEHLEVRVCSRPGVWEMTILKWMLKEIRW
jgi:hypothetical protein